MALPSRAEYETLMEHQLIPLIAGRGLVLSKFATPFDLQEYLPLAETGLLELYIQLHHYSNRLLLHDLLNLRPVARLEQLTHYGSETSVRRAVLAFQQLGLVKKWTDEYIEINVPTELGIGWFLEWYVAMVMWVQFRSPVLFNVGLTDTGSGGDFDVLAAWLGKLLYVECKSAPPKGIHNPEIAAFLERVAALKPDIALFLNDTHLRVKDKIVLMFEEELIRMKGLNTLKEMPIERVEEQVFHLDHYLYILNSKRDIRSNFRLVFQDYLSANLPGRRLLL